MKGLIAGFVCFIFLSFGAFSQSIYSAQGLGSINNQGNPSNFSMGGLGIGTPTQLNINTKNPAFLVVNPFSSFEIGLSYENRNFQGDGISGSSAGGGLNFLAYAFPILPGKWSSSFGILPFSTVDYDVFSEGLIEDAPNNATFLLDQQGEGGVTNLFWSNGVAINKNLFLGISTQFIFGSIERISRVAIFEDDITSGSEEVGQVAVSSDVNLNDTESYRGINLQLGLAYRFFLSESEFVNVGLTFSPKKSLNVQFDNLDSTTSIGADEVFLPTSTGFGISYQKLNVFKIGFDFENQAWEDANSSSDIYQNKMKLVLGGSFTPDYNNVNSYFKRIRYSLGFNYQELPYVVNNEALAEFGINFGASLPVSGYSSFDIGLGIGQLGESNNGLIKESYFKVVIGATINDRWFIKRKYD